jgi:hypothetical protein
MYDLDGDNKIAREELLAVLHMMVGANISEEQVSTYFFKYFNMSSLLIICILSALYLKVANAGTMY